MLPALVLAASLGSLGCIGSDRLECQWTPANYALQGSMASLQVVDWAQTRWFLHRGVPELNPLLGPHPSRARLGWMVAGSIVGHAAVSAALPNPWRIIWQSVSVAGEGFNVGRTAGIQGMLSLEWP